MTAEKTCEILKINVDKFRLLCYYTVVAKSGAYMGEWWNW